MNPLTDDKVRATLLCAGWFLMNGLSSPIAMAAEGPAAFHALPHPDTSGVLHVATLRGATSYYVDRRQNPAGPEFILTSQFAYAQGWEIEWSVYESTEQVLQALVRGEAHLAAAGLTQLPGRDEAFVRGPAHTQVNEQLVCHRDLRPMPATPADLAGRDITVTAGSSHAATLRQLATRYDGIEFSETADQSMEALLTAVAERELACTAVKSNTFDVLRRRMPHLQVAMNLNGGQSLGWYFSKGAESLAEQSHAWLATAQGQDALHHMESRYYSYISEFDFVDLRALGRRMQDRLPEYIDRFAEAEARTGMPADLLAALAYQESHWDPEAVSPTGVRGIMMLTRDTAELMGVNRLDPTAAIEGGARYLADRHNRLPDSIPEPDRTFMALASYNVGLGHILDARRLAEERGLNPDSWDDVRIVLPLKADENYYPHTRYGYARGNEPVIYVQRIRNYRSVISPAFD